MLNRCQYSEDFEDFAKITIARRPAMVSRNEVQPRRELRQPAASASSWVQNHLSPRLLFKRTRE